MSGLLALALLGFLGCATLVDQESRTAADAIDDELRIAHCVKVSVPFDPPGVAWYTVGRC